MDYLKLIATIESSFETDSLGNLMQCGNYSYSDNDAFYKAKGKYSLFKTCNCWTNSCLKSANVKTGYWTPFPRGILRHL